ncbi:MAG: hypothetical protein ACXW3O_03115 [Brevundimonas sp.]
MNRFAAQTIDLALARLPPALLPEGGFDAARRVPLFLAPGLQLYFECRLAGDDRSVDVSQHFFADQGGATALAALSDRCGTLQGESGATWRRLGEFARLWSEDGDLAGAIAEVGLEHDLGPDGDWVAAPAAFAAFRSDVATDRAAGRRFVGTVVPGGLAAWDRALAVVDRAVAHGLTPGRMVGAMLSRDGQLRLMLRGLSAPAVERFLREVGWPGEIAPLLALLAQPALSGPETRLVLGFAPDLTADCGLEIIHEPAEAGAAGRRALLAWLVSAGLAEADRVAALETWVGMITPAAAGAPWPDGLIARDLASPSGELAGFNGFPSHVKLNIRAGRPMPAKIYLGLAPVRRGSAGDAHV